MGIFKRHEKENDTEIKADGGSNAVYEDIAEILGIADAVKKCIASPGYYYKENAQRYHERGADKCPDDKTVILLCIADELINAGKAAELDFSIEKDDFIWNMKRVVPNGLVIDEDKLHEDGDVTEWAEALAQQWKHAGYVPAYLDIDSDSYVTFVCDTETIGQLKSKAAAAGFKISCLHEG